MIMEETNSKISVLVSDSMAVLKLNLSLLHKRRTESIVVVFAMTRENLLGMFTAKAVEGPFPCRPSTFAPEGD